MPTAVEPFLPVIETEPKTSVVARGAGTQTAQKRPTPKVSAPPIDQSANATDGLTSKPPDDTEAEELTPLLDQRQLTVGGYGISLLLHLSIFALLTTIIFQAEEPPLKLDSITLWEGEPGPLDADVVEEPVKLDVNLNPVEPEKKEDQPLPELNSELVKTDIVVQEILKPDATEPELADIPFPTGIAVGEGTMFSGRGTTSRQALVAAGGGNSESELAVAMGLRWLADHQQPDGSWSFDHRGEQCGESCTEPGGLGDCTMGATSMALLTFLGAGHTHQAGEYSSQVRSGLDHLLKNMLDTNDGIDLRQGNRQGNMYVQGLATIAICEAYAMTKDPALFRPSQRAINFIVHAQHKGGGWRYEINQPGDTSVVGWQVLALESARTSKLKVPRATYGKVTKFLNSVQSHGGARYGYMSPSDSPTTTAVGLLCRMYYGWERDRQEIREGVAYLSEIGPLPDNMYYNYYATQVLHHYGGDEWTQWNTKMRDHLVDTQIRRGHAKGSWDPRDPHANSGGRLYMTTLATMTLEVYYRHLPLYQWRDFSK